MPYRLSSLAERDLDEIWSYIAEDSSVATADRLVDDIIDRLDLLAEYPGMGRQRPEFGPGVGPPTVRPTTADRRRRAGSPPGLGPAGPSSRKSARDEHRVSAGHRGEGR